MRELVSFIVRATTTCVVALAAGRAAGEIGMARLILKVGSRLAQIRFTINRGRSDD